MKSVDETPTARSDYAVLSGTYMTMLAGLAAGAHRRGGFDVEPREVPQLMAASFALSKLVVHEKVETWLRAPFVDERPEGRRPKGRRLRYAVGELMTCTRCMGAWSALALVGLRLHAPRAGRTVTTVLAVSAGNDALQAGFSWLTARANAQAASVDMESELSSATRRAA